MKKFLNEDLKKYINQLETTILSSSEHMSEADIGTIIPEAKKQKLKEMGLKYDKDFLIGWPVFFTSTTLKIKESKQINLCALTFAALIIMQNEEDILNTKGHQCNRETLNILSCAIATLVVLQNDDGSWPSDFDAEYINVKKTGTINQTTLALATLIKFGFFKNNSKFTDYNVENSALKRRFQFAALSIDCLYNNAYHYGDQFSWGHTVPKSQNGVASVLPTTTIIDILLKLLDVFKQETLLFPKRNEISVKISDMINGATLWLRLNQQDDGSYKKPNLGSSLPYTCMATTAMLLNYEENATEIEKSIKLLIKKTYSKTIKSKVDSNDEYYDRIEINIWPENKSDCRKSTSVHEIFIEAIYALALLNYINVKVRLKSSISYKVKTEVQKMIIQIISRRSKIDELYFIQGRREAVYQYPIYCIYYALLTFKYYLRNCNSLEPIRSKIKTTVKRIAVSVTIFIFTFFLLSIFMDNSTLFDAMISIPLSLIGDVIAKILFKE